MITLMFRCSNTNFTHVESFAPKTCLPTYFVLNFCDFLAPVLSGATDPKWFLCFFSTFLIVKKIENNSIHYYQFLGHTQKVLFLFNDLVLRNHLSKLTKSQGVCTQIAIVHSFKKCLYEQLRKLSEKHQVPGTMVGH